VGGETNLFNVGVEGNSLQYQWSFGDGVTNVLSSLSTATHIYATNSCGLYTATVTVSDGQLQTVSSNLAVIVACDLAVTKLRIDLNFAKTNADSISLKAKLSLPGITSASQLTGFPVVVNVGGAQVPFTLNKKGHGTSTNGTCHLTYTKPTKKLPGYWIATISLTKGNWQEPLAAYDLTDEMISKPGRTVTLPVTVLIGNEAFAAEKQLKYTTDLRPTGIAR